MGKLKLANQLLKNMGWRYVIFRIKHHFLVKSNLFKLKFPTKKKVNLNYSLNEWKKSCLPFFINDKSSLQPQNFNSELISKEAHKILNGYIKFFNNEFIFLGKDYDWVTNPENKYKYNNQLHWSAINDFNEEAGDIKYVWEKSRFSYIYTLLRDEVHNSANHSEFIFNEIESWINANPINQGPNWKCSQEISLRVLNWIYVLYFYKNSNSLTAQRWDLILQSIYWQMHHVYGNIHFSRIAVRNNHAVTETMALYVVATLFQSFPNSQNWKEKGKNWFEEEIEYQVYEDGSYIQFSMNYNRVAIQLLTYAIQFANLQKEQFKRVVYERAYKTLNFLYQCQEGLGGELPNYGSNDGALFFPLSSCTFRDYRPQLNALHKLVTGNNLYQLNGNWEEDVFWWAIDKNQVAKFEPLNKKIGVIEFNIGGYYLYRDNISLTFIRCGNHNDRPHQADNLHIDIWVKGENVLVDGGSYKYNSNVNDVKYFFGTASHNTVLINNQDQMQKGNRFIWYNWSQCINAKSKLNENLFEFEGSIKAFEHLGNNIVHKRKVVKQKNELKWEVEDEILNLPQNATCIQNWVLNPVINEERIVVESNANLTKKEAWFSSLYGYKQSTISLQVQTNSSNIKTTVTIL